MAPCSARAEGDGARHSMAEAAFRSGTELIARGDAVAACESFEQSRRLEPTLGTLLRLADCYEAIGRTASAWRLFVEASVAASAAAKAEQERVATERANQLEQRLSKIALHVEESVEGERLEVNGVPIPAAAWISPLPVDPGPQHIEVSAPGHSPWAVDVDASVGPKTVNVSVPRLHPAEPLVAAPIAREAVAVPKRGFRDSMRTIGLVTGTVGLGGVALGGVFAAQASGGRECRKGDLNGCNESAALKNDARTAATRATIAFVAGGALLAAGVTLLVLAPAKREAHALFKPRLRKVKWLGTAGLTLQGEF